MNWADACPFAGLSEGTPTATVDAGVDVCLVRLGDQVFAVHDECTHESVPLSEGDVEDGTIECWRHGSRFDLRTGAVLNPPAVEPVATFPVRVRDDLGQVDVGP
jgi:3-phenylpropionate/trans-cinnamate dioxygenase ferredoxin subunit